MSSRKGRRKKAAREAPASASAPDPAAAPEPEPESAPGPAPAPEPAPGAAPEPQHRRSRRTGPWLLLVLALACIVLVVAGFGRGRVSFAEDVELTGVEITREVVAGGTATLKLHLHVRHPIQGDEWIFVHVDPDSDPKSGSPALGPLDRRPDVPAAQWHDQDLVHTVAIPIAPTAAPGRYAVRVGLYDRDRSLRLRLLDPVELDDRLLAAHLDVVADDADGATRTLSASEIHALAVRAPFRPLFPWMVAVVAAAVLAAAVAFLRPRAAGGEDGAEEDAAAADDAEEPASRMDRWRARMIYLPVLVPFVLGILVVLEFVKDDAYISFRYAHNLVTGQGLVFNHGERVEGFTNFLWVFVLAPFEALGWDLFQVCEVLAVILGFACLATTWRMTAWLSGDRRYAAFLWGALWLATSSSYVLWAKSGLEQPLGTLLPIAGAALLWPARALPRPERPMLAAGLVMGAACMTRPELHAMAILVGLPLVVDAVRARKVTRAQLLYVAGILAVTVPCHAFRYAYYGSLLPNTFYAKTSSSSLVWREGLKSLRDLLVFNHTGYLAVLAPLAFAQRRRLLEIGTMTLVAVAFMAYVVMVGADEMQWHRLYLPALPFLCVLAALGLRNLVEAALRLARRAGERAWAPQLAYGLGWAAVLLAARSSFEFTFKEVNGFNGHGDLAGTFHPDLGKFLVRHERPGGLVAFQDMGSTPYHAPDLDFLDFVGLVDRTVARARHDMGLHAFINTDERRLQGTFEARMRDYFFERNPEWTILTIYTPEGETNKAAEAFDHDPTGAGFGDFYRANGFQWGLWDDPRFRERYVPVRTWPRSRAYYLALWRRRDLWEQKPREVVLDAPPAGLGGAKARFEGGLELLGSETTTHTLERHEMFVTTWWKLPGPMARDLYFFVHLSKPGFQLPADHVPGDWMYPADRWEVGETLEDRTLVQLPPFTVTPGTYEVFLGVYSRSTGKRLAVVEGPNDGSDRLRLGTLVVEPLRPMVHQLIPPTRVDVMRKYPDRIVDPHRGR